MPTKTNIHVYQHPHIHTHMHDDKFAITVRSSILPLSLFSLSRSSSLRSHFTKLSKFLCKKKQLCANFLSEQIYLLEVILLLMVHAVHILCNTFGGCYQICILYLVLILTFMHGDLIQRL